MKFGIRVESRDHHLRASVRGRTTLRGMIRLADAIAEEAGKTGLRGVVIDCAGMTGGLGLTELFEVGNYYAERLSNVRLAGINMPAAWRDNRFSEDVIGNRGGRLKHFEDAAEAERWAAGPKEPPSEPPSARASG